MILGSALSTPYATIKSESVYVENAKRERTKHDYSPSAGNVMRSATEIPSAVVEGASVLFVFAASPSLAFLSPSWESANTSEYL